MENIFLILAVFSIFLIAPILLWVKDSIFKRMKISLSENIRVGIIFTSTLMTIILLCANIFWFIAFWNDYPFVYALGFISGTTPGFYVLKLLFSPIPLAKKKIIMKNTKLASKGTAIGMGILILMNMFGMKTFIYRFLDTHPAFRTYFLTTILTFGLFAMLYQLIGALKRSDLVIHQDKILSK